MCDECVTGETERQQREEKMEWMIQATEWTQLEVERVASYMKKHPDTRVVIKGYASPEGSIEVNDRIAKARAEAVKNILVKKYKINIDRITAEGQGVGDMFTEPDWNRVSICTIED